MLLKIIFLKFRYELICSRRMAKCVYMGSGLTWLFEMAFEKCVIVVLTYDMFYFWDARRTKKKKEEEENVS